MTGWSRLKNRCCPKWAAVVPSLGTNGNRYRNRKIRVDYLSQDSGFSLAKPLYNWKCNTPPESTLPRL